MLPDFLRLWNVWGTMEILLSETGHEGSYNMSASPASSQVTTTTLGLCVPPFFHPFLGNFEDESPGSAQR